MAKFNEMNDPMEGAFLYNPSTRGMYIPLWEGKGHTYICSLSKSYNNTLLWSHYADSHQGCCIEVEVTSPLQCSDVMYDPNLPVPTGSPSDTIDVLSHKSPYWKYEDEVRYFKPSKTVRGTNASRYMKVKIKSVLLGFRMSETDERFYTNLIRYIMKDEAFPVRKITKDELDCGLI